MQDVIVERAKLTIHADEEETPAKRKRQTRRSSIESTLKETRAGDVKKTTFHSVHQLSQRLGQKALTDHCGLVQLLHGYREERHLHHGTLFGPAPFGSSLVYQQRGSANIHIPQEWMFGDKLPKSPTSGPTSPSSYASRSAEVVELYKKRLQEGYDLPHDSCPDYYNWLEEENLPVPGNQSATVPAVAATSNFLQLPLIDDRPPSMVQPTQTLSADVVWDIEQHTRSQSESDVW